jgi:hypothetical protein
MTMVISEGSRGGRCQQQQTALGWQRRVSPLSHSFVFSSLLLAALQLSHYPRRIEE